MFNKKGGVELTTVIIIVVLVGALVIGIASALTSDLKNTANTGLNSNKDYLDNIYAQIPSNNEGGDVGGGGNVFPQTIYAEDVLLRGFPGYPNVYSALVEIWNKIPDGGFATVNHTHDNATEESAGFMSVADKIKLNGLTNYIHPDTHPASMITGLSAVATSGNYNDLINRPNSLPANGGNADTVDGKHASDFVTQDDYNELFTFVSDGKNTVASAITDKGVPATGSDTFGKLADKIRQIPSGGKYPPGYKWTKVIPPAGINVSRIGITYHDGYFQFVQYNEDNKNVSLYKSQNGINWTEEILDIYPSEGVVNRTHLIYGNDKMMVIFSAYYNIISGAGNRTEYYLYIYTSTNNGSSWTEKRLSKETSLKDSVCFGNNRFVIAGYHFLASSTDGINWTEIETSRSYDKVIYGGDRFVAVSSSCATSTDGINWQHRGTYADYSDVCYGNGKFIARGYYLYQKVVPYIAQSTNGSDWEESVFPNPIDDFGTVGYGNGIFVTTGRAKPETTCSDYWILISKDGVHWTYIPWNNGTNLKDICYKPGMFLAKGSDNYFYISTESDM